MFDKPSEDQELWRRLDWNDVRTFLAVAECGSLNAAARLLGMTQPTISRRMEEFEYRLRAKLFDRSSRGVALTEAGLMVRDLAQSMARLGGTIMRDVAGHDHSDVGRVRMTAPDGISGFLLAPALPNFQMANPQVQLSIDCGLWIGSMLESEPDLALEMSETCPPDLVSTPIATLHYCGFASREYLDLYGQPKTLQEVAQHRTVRHTSHSEQKSTWNPKATAVGILAESHFVSNSSAATFQAIRSGAGIGALPTFVLMFAPELVMLDLEPWSHPVLFLRHRPMIENQLRVKLVKDWLLKLFDPTDQPWFREEFVHPSDFERYLPETPETLRPARRGLRRAAG
ncbi:MAG TPA: LysR family transcriptional regulator [Caulobacteraceae bacterium]|jgi:DNA-binding transcriptional LysR family regulator|nr:LysR family transcriptional regulator [Caulobacteraceae bacterium]